MPVYRIRSFLTRPFVTDQFVDDILHVAIFQRPKAWLKKKFLCLKSHNCSLMKSFGCF